MLYILAIALCVAADQLMKWWTVANLEEYGSALLLPGIVELKYVQNTGGGFSILAGHTWILVALTVVLMAILGWLLIKKLFPHPLAMWSLTIILGGGIGNLIDRIRLGFVVDMFNLQFMEYPVFNIADIFVVCGAIAFAVYYLLIDGKAEKANGNKTEETADDGNDQSES